MDKWARIDRLAGKQHSLVTHDQLRTAGWSDHEIVHAYRRGQLHRIREGVYRTTGAALSVEQVWMGAALAAGDRYLLSHQTGGLVHKFQPASAALAIHLLTDIDRRTRLAGVTSHRTLLLPERDRVTVRGLPVTSVARTIADVSVVYSAKNLGLVADDAIRRGILHPRDLWRVAATFPRTGRRSPANFLAILPERVPGYQPGDSNPELRVRTLIQRAGLEVPVALYKTTIDGRKFEIDLAWPLAKHGLEWDSFEFHGQVEPFHADRAKRRKLRRAGWTIDELTCRTPDDEILEIAAIATDSTRRARAELEPLSSFGHGLAAGGGE
jgi:hypothetical protein